MSETRGRIAAHVQNNPGIHFSEIVRTLDLGTGQVQYHLKKLCTDETCIALDLYGRTHYYPPQYNEWERGALALLRRETAGDIIAVLFETDSTTPASLAERVDIARSTLEWHVNRLVEQDIVIKQPDSRHRITLTLTHPDATARLLNVSGSAPWAGERLLDRYTRLIDRLLEE